MAQEKGRWVTIESRHIFIKNGESLDEAFKRATGQSKQISDNEDRKEKQIENNKKVADDLNDEKKYREHKGKNGFKVQLSKEDAKKIAEYSQKNFSSKSKEGIREDGKFQLASGEVAEPAPEGTTDNGNGKYFSPDGKHWFVKPYNKDNPWNDPNYMPSAPKLDVGEKKSASSEPDADGLYDITDKWHKGDFKDDLFSKDNNKRWLEDRTTRFIGGVGDNAQEALDVLSDNMQGILIDSPADTTISFTDKQGRKIDAKARVDRQGRVSWTVKIDGKRSGSGWASRDMADMYPDDPKDFSMSIPASTYYSYNQKVEQPAVKIDIKDGKVSKSIRGSKELNDSLDRSIERANKWRVPTYKGPYTGQFFH